MSRGIAGYVMMDDGGGVMGVEGRGEESGGLDSLLRVGRKEGCWWRWLR